MILYLLVNEAIEPITGVALYTLGEAGPQGLILLEFIFPQKLFIEDLLTASRHVPTPNPLVLVLFSVYNKEAIPFAHQTSHNRPRVKKTSLY
jgi:hypothetical protein